MINQKKKIEGKKKKDDRIQFFAKRKKKKKKTEFNFLQSFKSSSPRSVGLCLLMITL